MTLLEAALSYAAQGFRVVPIPARSKGPVLTKWQTGVEATPRNFKAGGNIGVVMGPAADVDLDCPEAIAAAPYLLNKTARFGHSSKRASHYIYLCPGLAESEDRAARKWTAPDGGGLIELRTGGGGFAAQTVFSPSVHISGEPIEWEEGDSVESVREIKPDELLAASHRLAAVTLLARFYPKQGARHDAALVLGGFLAGCSIELDGRGNRRRQPAAPRQN